MNMIQCCFGVALMGLVLTGPRPLNAQAPGLANGDFSSLYSRGVNAYFAGRTSEAEFYLSQAVALNPQDPRAYYFRALSLLRLGRLEEARGDMMVGGSLEAQRPNRFAVGRALERVQGSNRLMLERYRRQGRMMTEPSGTAGHVVRKLEPSPLIAEESYVLRNRVVIPLDRLLDDEPRPLSADELASRRSRMHTRRDAAAAAVEGAARPAGENPFRDDPRDEVGETAGPELSEPTTIEEPVEEVENPFGNL